MLKRMWINAPSTIQDFHRFHRTNVLVDYENSYYTSTARVYFLSGPVISMEIPRNILSDSLDYTKWHS